VPDSITVASVQQYKANVELLLQQQSSLLSDKVTHGSYVGKKASLVEQFGEATPVERTSRHGDTPLLDLSQEKRWVSPRDYEWGSMIDKQDQLRAIVNLSSPYAQAASAGMNRKKDDIILTGFFGTSLTGEEGTTSESWSTTYDVGVNVGGTASGMNAAKLKNAIRLLITANKQELMEPVFGAIGSYEHDSLLGEIQVINKDYNGGTAVLVDGKVSRFMGIGFTITERLVIASGNRQIPVWVKSGAHLGTWAEETVVRISERADKGYANQVYVSMTMGACRTQLGKIIKVLCDDQI
jgi:hypothetical protein